MFCEIQFMVSGIPKIIEVWKLFYPYQIELIESTKVTDMSSLKTLMIELSQLASATLKHHENAQHRPDCTNSTKVAVGLDEGIIDEMKIQLSQATHKSIMMVVSFGYYSADFKEVLWLEAGEFDLKNRKFNVAGELIGDIVVQDLNVPHGFNINFALTNPIWFLKNEELVLLALQTNPTFPRKVVTSDYIDLARKLCYKRKLLDPDDVVYLQTEKDFLISGSRYEHSFS